MPRKLKWVDVTEVSVVDAGANLKRRFPVAKSLQKGCEMPDYKEMIEAALATPVDGEADVAKNAESDDQRDALIALARVADALGVSKALEPKVVEIEVEKDIEDNDDDNGDDEVSDELENVSTELAKRFDEVQKALDAEKAAREAVEKRLAEAQDAQEYAAWVAKAKDNLQYVPGSSIEDMAKELHAVAKVSPELADAQYARLSATSALLAKSEAFKAVGTSGHDADNSEAWVQKRADQLVKDGLDPVKALIQAGVEAEKR